MKEKPIILFFLIITFSVSAQKNEFRIADKQYERMRYAHAIEEYETALKYSEGKPEVYKKLANSYYQVGDMKNAERVYKVYFQDTSKVEDKDVSAVFEFAQTLAQNGHYEKAAKWYKKYEEIYGDKDERGKKHHLAYIENIQKFYEDSTLYSVSRLDINSPQSDFAPTFYKNGIVFASARKQEHGIRRVHSWNNSAFYDFYYVDTASVNHWVYETSKDPEYYDHKVYSYLHANQDLYSDETYNTSNDSRTVGYHAHVYNAEKEEHHSETPKPFSKKINSKFHESSATFAPGDSLMLFTRNSYNSWFPEKSDENVTLLKIYMSKKKGDDWSKPEELPFNGENFSCAHPAFGPDGKTVIFASDRPGGHGKSDLYKVTYNKGKWSNPVNLGPEINTEGKETFPFIDEHGILYFSSNGQPGLGGLDLFTYNFETEKLTHLNYPMSSKKDDFGVVVWDNGRKGYLSSNRDFGGYDDDLYMFTAQKTLKLKGKVYDLFTKKHIPEANVVLKDTSGNIIARTKADSTGGFNVEVDYDKYYALTGAHQSYFDTTETLSTIKVKTDLVKQDLYLWNKLDVSLQGLVTDRETGDPLDSVHVKIKNAKTKEIVFETHTPADGIFRRMLEDLKMQDTIAYDLHFEKEKYLAKNVPFTTVVNDTLVSLHQQLDLTMDKIKVGTDIGKLLKLNPIYFDLGKWDIREDASAELDKVVQVMQDNPTISIELGSHTDCRASASYNQSLSEKRAKSSASYIISKGIDEERIYGKGYGESKLINHCECEGDRVVPCSEEEHQLNRRTEFLIVKTE